MYYINVRKRSFFLAILFFLALSIYARDIIISVEDEDLGWPLEGAVVSLRSGHKFICDANGVARVALPDDKQVIIQVSYPGYDALMLTIPPASETSSGRFTASLRLGGIMVGRELVIEAERPETSETKTGRSVAITERELTRTAEIGIVEDVMSSVKLLPGVGYSGMFSAFPSIRGGDPGDLMAAFDGFYIELPYHLGGGVSIFDPKMVSSVRLSHGVFSARYGYTISGLMEVSSKSPNSAETEFEAAISTSAASLNLSFPFNKKGGMLFMGKITYWDTLVWAAKKLSQVVDNENLAMINSVSTAPFIRSLSLATNYRFTPYLEWRLNSFIGSDGVGADVKTEYDDEGIKGTMDATADYKNSQGFLITGINASPTPKVALRIYGGAGFMGTYTDDTVNNAVTVNYNQDFLDKYDFLKSFPFNKTTSDSYTDPNVNVDVLMDSIAITGQLRADLDWDIGNGFITAFGIQEFYTMWKRKGDLGFDFIEINIAGMDPAEKAKLPPLFNAFIAMYPELAIVIPRGIEIDTRNHGITTSGYGLVEYTSPSQRFGAELGMRLDYMVFLGKDFTVPIKPAFNPRLNVDFGLIKNNGIIDSLDMTIGTGLFSSMDKFFTFFDTKMFKSGLLDDMEIDAKLNRAWTSVIGFKLDFAESYSFNIEGYYKRVFHRAYITADLPEKGFLPDFHFDGVGNVWGIDMQLQKMESRFVDGWISYSFNWAKYYNPEGGDNTFDFGSTETKNAIWIWPSFHRFHNCNIVLNIKPANFFNIGVRFGFASGQPQNKVSDKIDSYPVVVIDDNNNPLVDENGLPIFIQKYSRKSWYDENERSSWSLPLDIKFSFYLFDRNGRVNTEIYLAGENLSTLFYKPMRDSLNDYTGTLEESRDGSSFDLPIPMISFGFKWRY